MLFCVIFFSKKYSMSLEAFTAPEEWSPRPVQHTEAPEAIPPTVPPKPFRDSKVFDFVDGHAMEVSV